MVALTKDAHTPIPPTDTAVLDRKLERLQGKKRVWTRVPLNERIRYLDRVLRDMYTATPELASSVAISSGFDQKLCGITCCYISYNNIRLRVFCFDLF